jgi:hypothetical protein
MLLRIQDFWAEKGPEGTHIVAPIRKKSVSNALTEDSPQAMFTLPTAGAQLFRDTTCTQVILRDQQFEQGLYAAAHIA